MTTSDGPNTTYCACTHRIPQYAQGVGEPSRVTIKAAELPVKKLRVYISQHDGSYKAFALETVVKPVSFAQRLVRWAYIRYAAS